MDGRENVVVCGVDGSSGSERALAWAIEEAVRRGATLRVVTAWWWDGAESLEAVSTTTPETAFGHAQEIQDEAMSRALAAAEEVPEVERLMIRARPSEALCTAALDAEMLVLGSHGHGTLHDKLVGSTSQRAIHHARCPVVLLPDPEHLDREARRAWHRRRKLQASSEAPSP